jgi:hypothetical protein
MKKFTTPMIIAVTAVTVTIEVYLTSGLLIGATLIGGVMLALVADEFSGQ